MPFSQADIPSGDPVFVELTRYFNSYGGKCGFVIRLKKSLYGQAKAACLWYEKLCFMVSKVDLCMSMSKTLMCVVYVDYFLF